MKNLLNDAMKELVIRVNGEIIKMKNEMKEAETKGLKLNILYARRNNILKLLNKLIYLGEQFEIRFPEDEMDVNPENFKYITEIYLEDMLNVINEAGILEYEC